MNQSLDLDDATRAVLARCRFEPVRRRCWYATCDLGFVTPFYLAAALVALVPLAVGGRRSPVFELGCIAAALFLTTVPKIVNSSARAAMRRLGEAVLFEVRSKVNSPMSLDGAVECGFTGDPASVGAFVRSIILEGSGALPYCVTERAPALIWPAFATIGAATGAILAAKLSPRAPLAIALAVLVVFVGYRAWRSGVLARPRCVRVSLGRIELMHSTWSGSRFHIVRVIGLSGRKIHVDVPRGVLIVGQTSEHAAEVFRLHFVRQPMEFAAAVVLARIAHGCQSAGVT